MQFDKSQVLELLKSRGQHDNAAQAESELPQTVDTDKDQNLLEKFGITPMEIISAFAGGGGIGGVAGRLAGAAGNDDKGGDGKGGIGGALGGLLGR